MERRPKGGGLLASREVSWISGEDVTGGLLGSPGARLSDESGDLSLDFESVLTGVRLATATESVIMFGK